MVDEAACGNIQPCVDEFDVDERTQPDGLAALPMRALVFGAANDDAAVRS